MLPVRGRYEINLQALKEKANRTKSRLMLKMRFIVPVAASVEVAGLWICSYYYIAQRSVQQRHRQDRPTQSETLRIHITPLSLTSWCPPLHQNSANRALLPSPTT
jgi:hypothetical protein